MTHARLGRQDLTTPAALSPARPTTPAQYRKKQSARTVPSADVERFARVLRLGVMVLAAVALGVALATRGRWDVAGAATLVATLPVLLGLFFGLPAVAVAQAKRGGVTATGRVLDVDTSGHVVNDDAQQRALVEVHHEGHRHLLVAIQHGLDLRVGQGVEVRFRGADSQVCFVLGPTDARAAAPRGLAAPDLTPREVLDHVEALERTGVDERDLAEVAAHVGRLEGLAARLDAEAVATPVTYDADGAVVQLPVVAELQRTGVPGRALVLRSELLGETDETRTFYLEVRVTPSSGTSQDDAAGHEPFEAGMRLVLPRSAPPERQVRSAPGAELEVRFWAQDRRHVVLAADPAPGSRPG